MKKKNIAILLEFGFHEIKKYIHSGLAHELSKEFNIIWFAKYKDDKDFDAYFKSTGHLLIYFEEDQFNRKNSKLENLNQTIRRNWLVSKQLGAFHNHSKVKAINGKSSLIGNSFFKAILEKITLKEVKKRYFHPGFSSAFAKYNIEILLTTGYASSFAKSAVITAQHKNLSVNYLVNSWKDLFINNFLPFHDLSNIFVWSKKMKNDYLRQMPYLKKEKFVVSGNPSFDVLLEGKVNQDRSYYAQKYGISENANWLLYTMMPVGLVKDEIETIEYTAKQLSKSFTDEEFVILVRKNPTHKVSEFKNRSLSKNIRITEHYCSFNREKDMIVQSPEGEKEWIDLLHHCSLNLSVPSTVSLEFLTLQKPVLNIAYNNLGALDERTKQFFNAGFYKPLFKLDQVKKITHPKEIVEFLKTFLPEVSGEPLFQQTKASTKIINSIKKQ